MPIVSGAGRFTPPGNDARARYVEHQRTADLSIGTYSIQVDGVDGQSPHTEDEVYVVTAGRAVFTDAGGEVGVQAGDTLFVPAGMEHRFSGISADSAAVVIFGPPEDTRA